MVHIWQKTRGFERASNVGCGADIGCSLGGAIKNCSAHSRKHIHDQRLPSRSILAPLFWKRDADESRVENTKASDLLQSPVSVTEITGGCELRVAELRNRVPRHEFLQRLGWPGTCPRSFIAVRTQSREYPSSSSYWWWAAPSGFSRSCSGHLTPVGAAWSVPSPCLSATSIM